jgi:hypothetical protein
LPARIGSTSIFSVDLSVKLRFPPMLDYFTETKIYTLVGFEEISWLSVVSQES